MITRAPWSVAQMIPLATFGRDAAAVRVEHAHRKDLHVGRGAGDAERVVHVRGDDARDVGAVTVGVDATVAARLDEVLAREHRTREVLVVGLDPGVDDRDDDAGAPGHGPRRSKVVWSSAHCWLRIGSFSPVPSGR